MTQSPTSQNWQSEIGALISECHIGFLATSGRNGPETSMAPYALFNGTILLHLSGLARHTSNLKASPKAGFMICTAEMRADSPLALPRLSLQGDVGAVSETEYEAAKACYLQSIPAAEPLFEFADFRMFKLNVSNIHWVGGFGSARVVTKEQWASICEAHQKEC